MTGIDGAATASFPFQDHAASMYQQLPDVLATLEAEYFVEWQVADIAPLLNCGTSIESQVPFR